MSRYSAPTEDGRKHYVVSLVRWGKETQRVVLAEDLAAAKYEVLGRRGPGEYVRSARRARPEEVGVTEVHDG